MWPQGLQEQIGIGLREDEFHQTQPVPTLMARLLIAEENLPCRVPAEQLDRLIISPIRVRP